MQDARWVSREELVQAFAGEHPTIKPSRKGAIAQIERALALGFRGVTIEPGAYPVPIYADDRTLYPIYAYLEDKDLPVVLLTGGNAGPDLSYSNPVQVDRVASDFPQLRIVVAHGNVGGARCSGGGRQPVRREVGSERVHDAGDIGGGRSFLNCIEAMDVPRARQRAEDIGALGPAQRGNRSFAAAAAVTPHRARAEPFVAIRRQCATTRVHCAVSQRIALSPFHDAAGPQRCLSRACLP